MTTLQATTRNTHAANVRAVGSDRFKTGLMPKTDQISGPAVRDAKKAESLDMKTIHVIVCGDKDVIREIVRAMEASSDALGLKSMEKSIAEYRPNCVSISIKLNAFDLEAAYEELENRFFSNVALRCGIGITGDQAESINPVFDGSLESVNLSFQAAF